MHALQKVLNEKPAMRWGVLMLTSLVAFMVHMLLFYKILGAGVRTTVKEQNQAQRH